MSEGSTAKAAEASNAIGYNCHGACRGLSDAKKAFLYDTSVELGKAEENASADAAATKVLSQMKQLELSGTAGNILLPTEEAAEVSAYLYPLTTGNDTCLLHPQ